MQSNNRPVAGRCIRAMAVCAVFAAVVISGQPAAAAVDAAPGFGDDQGIVTTTLAGKPSAFVDATRLDNGKIITVGRTLGASGTDMDMVVARMRADGSLDTDFAGGNGYIVVGFDEGGGNNDLGYGIDVLGSGQIVIAGYVDTPTENQNFGVALISSDGTGVDAQGNWDFNAGRDDRAYDVAVSPGDNIYVAGESCDATTLTPCNGVVVGLDGMLNLNTAFGAGGVFQKSSSGANNEAGYVEIEIRASGTRIVVAGQTDDLTDSLDPLVTQLDTSGTGDSNFGNQGTDGDFVHSQAGDTILIDGLELASDGTIVIAGSVADFDGSTTTDGIGFLKLTNSGRADSGFGTSTSAPGITALNPGPGFDAVYDLEIDSLGRVVFVGLREDANGSGRYDSLVGRLSNAGVPDDDFVQGGFGIPTSFSGSNWLNDLVLVDDQEFVAVGTQDSDGMLNNGFFSDTAFVFGGQVNVPGGASSGGGSSGGGGAIAWWIPALLIVLIGGRGRRIWAGKE